MSHPQPRLLASSTMLKLRTVFFLVLKLEMESVLQSSISSADDEHWMSLNKWDEVIDWGGFTTDEIWDEVVDWSTWDDGWKKTVDSQSQSDVMCPLPKFSCNSGAFCECWEEWGDMESRSKERKKEVETPCTLMNCRERWIPHVSFSTSNVHQNVKATFECWDEWDDIYAAGSFNDKLKNRSMGRKKAVDKPSKIKRHLTPCGKNGRPRRFPLQPLMSTGMPKPPLNAGVR